MISGNYLSNPSLLTCFALDSVCACVPAVIPSAATNSSNALVLNISRFLP